MSTHNRRVHERPIQLLERRRLLSVTPADVATIEGSILVISGTAGADAITVTTKALSIVVTRGSTVRKFDPALVTAISIDGLGGDDSIVDDLFLPATINGGDGNDTLQGGGVANTVHGNGGDDTLLGGEGDDNLFGDGGIDVLAGNGGNDLIDGGAGADSLAGHAGRDRLFGGPGDDRIDGGASGDWLYGQGGADQINGEGGDDRLFDGDQEDTVHGNAGNDSFISTFDVYGDQYFGDGGLDSSDTDIFNNDVSIELGRIYIRADEEGFYGFLQNVLTVSGTNQDDTITVSKTPGGNVLAKLNGQSTEFSPDEFDVIRLRGGDGNDTIIVVADPGDTNIDAGDGDDFVQGGGLKDTIDGEHGDDTLRGGGGNDFLQDGFFGQDQALNVLNGQSGNDLLFNASIQSTLLGGPGNDELRGGGGFFDGGPGSDKFWPGAFTGGVVATISYADSPVGVRIGFVSDPLGAPGENDRLESDLFSGVGFLPFPLYQFIGSAFDDTIIGSIHNDTLIGGDGDDLITDADGSLSPDPNDDLIDGGNGNDTVSASNGDDTISGGPGDDELHGDDGNDSLDGDGGDDALTGDSGNDFLQGDVGTDTLRGGASDDTFVANDGTLDHLFGDSGNDSAIADEDDLLTNIESVN